MRFEHLLAGAVFSLAVMAACRDATGPEAAVHRDPKVVVARWKGGEIRRGEIQEALAGRLAAVPKPISPEAWREIVRQVIERRVRVAMLYEEAKAKGFAGRPEVLRRQTAAEERILAEDLLARETASAKAADPQVAAEVARRLGASRPEEARKFSHIFLRAPESDPAARARAAARMETIRQELGRGANFNQLAEKYSTSVTARGGGRIEWTARRSLNRAAADVLFALKEGEVSAVVAAHDGLHLFRLDGIRPGTPVDAEAIRRDVRRELDAEARNAAIRARRQQELDARGVEPPPPSPGREGEAAARLELENRLLAEARRAQGLTPEIAARIAEARREAVVEAYRQTLVAGLDTRPTEEEIARYHRDHATNALFLRDFQIDVLFFPQTGDSVADVYAAGEAVGTALREGVPFDDLLRRPARPDARLCREAHGVDLTALARTSIRLQKALLRLGPGEISPTIYLDGPRTEVVPGSCVLEGRGVAFVRLRALGTLPLPAVREAIGAALAHDKEVAGIEAMRRRLIAASGLQILAPEG